MTIQKRAEIVEDALKEAAQPPLKVMESACESIELLGRDAYQGIFLSDGWVPLCA